MRILLFDPFHGAAGDMILGSLLALGADRTSVLEAMRSVVAEPTIEEVNRAGIRAISVSTHAPATHRTLEEVLARVSSSTAPEPAQAMAARVFRRLAAAEGSVHGAQAHFHEVGADDAIADIIGACTALHSLHVDSIAVHPVALGGGFIKGKHGIYPVPAPATVAVIQDSGLLVRMGDEDDGELCTPTGAALLAEFSTIAPPAVPAAVRAIGYGAGKRDPPHIPNVLRALLLDTAAPFHRDRVDILETNVDDVSGEVLAYTLARLMEAGARDASVIPAMMKKGRIGHLVRVICSAEDTEKLAQILSEELGTLGIRCIPSVHRLIVERSIERIPVEIMGRPVVVEVKCSWMGGRITGLKAEYEHARACAEKLHIPLRDVIRIVEEEAWKRLEGVER
jgi:pyridinium-3,5-bisthiocarboxylic acid mononucleotide nickel chelatase